MVGSTDVRMSVGEEMADRIRKTHDHLVSEVISGHGGTVVKGTGDGLIATFVGAADAVAASVAVHQAVDVWDPGEAGPQTLRIGISAGDVTWDEGDCFGTPVIEAARLCAAAAGGQTFAADVVRVLARGRHGQQLVAVGALQLKGLAEPVTTYEVAWARLDGPDDAAFPLPSALALDSEFCFVGRDGELRRLLDQWSAAESGTRGLTLLAGEPGIGKTRLASEAARGVHQRDGIVLYGRCDEDLGMSYQPFVEALQHFVDHRSVRALQRELGRHAGDLVRLCPDLATAVPGLAPPLQSEPEAERHRLFDAVAGWLRAASGSRPVLIIVDDLHAAERPALQMLRHVVRSTAGCRLLIVATYRDTDLGRTHPLAETLAALRESEEVERLSLGGLDESAVTALMGEASDPDLCKAVYAETEGNPFFAREVLRHLRETGAITHLDGRWVADRPLAKLGIPEGVREVVGRRLARLSAAANDACSLAAVIGHEFTLRVLGTVAGGDEDELIAALDEAVAARLLVETGIGSYRFAHALVRSTLYDEVGLTARVRLHRRVGLAFEAVQPDDVSALARHFGLAAAAGEEERAARYGLLAAQQALAALAIDQARDLANGALVLLGDLSDDCLRCDLLTCRGTAERLLGDPAHRETLLDAARVARAIVDTDRLAAAVLANVGGVSDVSGLDADRVELVEAALAAMPTTDTAIRAQLLAALAYGLGSFAGVGDTRCFDLADQALAMARRVGDPVTLTVVLHHHFLATQVPHTLDQRLANSEENVAVAEQIGDPVAIGWAVQDRARARAENGDTRAMLDDFERVEKLRHEYDLRQFHGSPCMVRASVALLEGRIDEAETLANEAFRQFSEKGHRSALAFYVGQLIAIRRDQGRLEEILPLVEQATVDNPTIVALHTARMLIYADLDRRDEALEVLRMLAVDDFAVVPYDWLWLQALSNCAEVGAWLGDRATAAVLLERLRPFHRHCVTTVATVGSAARFVGAAAATLERFDEAEASFAEAAAMETRLGAVTCLARTRLDWARMLLTRTSPTDRERARALLDQALATARTVGLPVIERRASLLASESARNPKVQDDPPRNRA